MTKYNANGQEIFVSGAGTTFLDANGATRFTDASASGAVKLYNADGSINVTILPDENTYKGAYAPNGSKNVVGGSRFGWSPTGADNVSGAIPQLFPYVSNFKLSNMSGWMTKYAQAVAGTGRARLAFLGDSTTLGVGATANTALIQDNVRNTGMPAQVASQWTTAGIPNNYDVSIGYQFAGVADTRFTLGAGWLGTGVATAGGAAVKATTTGTPSTWSFGATTFDRIQIWWYDASSFGSFEVLIDGVSQGTIVTNGAPTSQWKSTTYSPTLGTHTIAINWVSGGEVDVGGVAIWKSGTPQIDIYNFGIGGSQSNTWAVNNTFFPLILSKSIAADMYVLNLGINDLVNAGISVATYKSNIQTIITALKTATPGCQVIICVPQPCNNTLFNAASGGIVDLRTALRELRDANDIPLIDWYKFFNETYTPANYYFNGSANDTLHPNTAAYGLEATAVRTLLSNVFTL